MTTLIGISVVDLHRWDRNQRSGGSAFNWMNADDERPQFLQVRSMANLIGRGLRKPEMRYYSQNNPRQEIQQRRFIGGQLQMLLRITNAFGETARPNNGKHSGRGYVMTCFICRQYQPRQTNTNWWCSACKMPLCRKKRRDLTCYQEHMDNCHDMVLGCYTRQHFTLPKEYRKYAVGSGNNQQNVNDLPSINWSGSDSSEDEAEQMMTVVPRLPRMNTRQTKQGTNVPAVVTERQRETRSASGSSSGEISQATKGIDNVVVLMVHFGNGLCYILLVMTASSILY